MSRSLYRARAHRQGLAWAAGYPQHNQHDDECCPDFSCCNPDLFERDPEGRLRYLNAWERQRGLPETTRKALDSFPITNERKEP